MEVQFKVYTFWNENDKPEVRRFGIDKNVVSSFQYLNAKLQDIFPKLKGKHFSVLWKDEEGDDVMISSDDEIMMALTSMSDDLKKLYIHCNDTEKKNDECNIVFTTVTDNIPTSSNVEHAGVVCDGCDSPITGFRYNCTYCDDYDLCSKCETAGKHPEHCMVRVPAPALPRPMVKAAVKRSRHLFKSLQEQIKKQRHESERHREQSQCHGQARNHGHERAHGQRRQSRDNHRPRTSWIEVLGTYMNEFANLAGDVGLDAETQEGQGKASQKPKSQASNSSAQPNPKSCPLSHVVNIEQLIMDHLSRIPTSQSSSSNEDAEMGQGDRNTEEDSKTDAPSKTAEESTPKADEAKKDDSPDRTDGWTVIINKEMIDLDAKGEQERPFGFNLPEEFQEKVRINVGQSLYPPLNTATAVLITKEPEQTKPTAPEENKDAATGGEKPKDAKPEGARHPMAHIQAALEQMMAMGFTNESNWLMQILENKDGNISAVLDLLTPTITKK